MTLLVAQCVGANAWMVADSAITGGNLAQREREYALKIEPSLDGKALVGYSGDHHHGTRLIHQAAVMPAGREAIKLLLEGHHTYPSIEFAYAYTDDTDCRLSRIADGRVEELQTFHLGSTGAFEDFQRTRIDRGIDHAPAAIKTFFAGSRAPEPIPDGLATAITSMWQVFVERTEHDVGGWPTAYFLTKAGAFLCSYGYAVSDPILAQIAHGSLIPHGTAPAGGFGLSVTELGDRQGVVVYWLQRPGGTVFVRTESGYETHQFEGTPTPFIATASKALNQNVEIWFGDQPAGAAQHFSVLHDENGTPSMVVADHGASFTFSVLNVASPFKTNIALDLVGRRLGALRQVLQIGKITISVNKDHRIAVLNLKDPSSNKVEMSASDVDVLIDLLCEVRTQMQPSVPAERPPKTRELVAPDPAWRTELPVHPGINGVILRLRHPGLGWLAFLLPWHEVKNLGAWLSNNATPTGEA